MALQFTKESIIRSTSAQSLLASTLAQTKDADRAFAGTGVGAPAVGLGLFSEGAAASKAEQLPIPPGFAAGNAIRALLSVYAARNGGVLPPVYSSAGALLLPALPLPHVSLVNLSLYEIRICDDSGGLDVDFPAVDHSASLTSIGVERFALSDASSDVLILGFSIRQLPPEVPDVPGPLLMHVDRFPARPPASVASGQAQQQPFPVYLMAATLPSADYAAPPGSLPATYGLPQVAPLAPPSLHSNTFYGGSGAAHTPLVSAALRSPQSSSRDRASSDSRSSTNGRESGFGGGGGGGMEDVL
jgi:hypothetical protein